MNQNEFEFTSIFINYELDTNFAQECLILFSTGPLRNENVACWEQCGAKGGPCSFCGGGSCCRQGWTDGTGCTGTNGCDGHSCCVEPKGTK